MTQTDKSLLPHKHSCWKKKIVCFAITLLAVAGLIAALPFCPWFIRMHTQPVAAAETARLQKQVLDVSDGLASLNERVNALAARVGQNTVTPATPRQGSDNAAAATDVAALSSAVTALQTQVQQAGSHAAHTRQETQALLAAAIAFIQLRETATTGQGFAPELAAMRAASKNDGTFQNLLGALDFYAAKGAPVAAMLREELLAREAAASQAVDRNAAMGWREKILAELQTLISIRPLHGGGETAFAAMEAALAKNDLAGALTALKTLPPEAQQALGDWQAEAEARQKIDETLRAIADRFTALAASDMQDSP